jgi:alpha-glucosidase
MLLPLAIITLTSPNNLVSISVEARPALTWSATLRGQALIEPSPLGITVDGVNLAASPKAGRIIRSRAGACNAASVPFTGAAPFTLELRACNGGVAFRHIVPGAGARIPDEATAFRLPAAAMVWYHDLEGHYEALYANQPAAGIPNGQWLAPPVTYRLPGGAYGSITEAALYRYPGMALQSYGGASFAARLGHTHPPSYPFRLRYKDDIERLSRPAPVEGVITTPWRVTAAGADLNALINSNMVEILSPPPDPALFPQGAKTDWIKPGRAVWRYLDGGQNDQATVREFSALASKLGFEYQVVEGFWQKWSPADLKSVVADSRKLGVGIFLWKHSNQLRTPAARAAFFDLCRDAGAAGVKIDFFDHEAKEVVELYEIMLREAAQRKLLVNFHGSNKPTGEPVTWPNELTREGVRGMESRKAERARHNTIIPFTRLLAGPADYTPVHFGDRRNDTTWAHQAASAAVLTSGLLTYAAHPKALLENPAVEIIKSIPADWDESIALPQSSIGETAVIARRKGRTWFLAALNGVTARRIEVPLGFLGPGKYQSLAAADDAGTIKVATTEVTRATRLTLDLLPGGGYVARFRSGIESGRAGGPENAVAGVRDAVGGGGVGAEGLERP